MSITKKMSKTQKTTFCDNLKLNGGDANFIMNPVVSLAYAKTGNADHLSISKAGIKKEVSLSSGIVQQILLGTLGSAARDMVRQMVHGRIVALTEAVVTLLDSVTSTDGVVVKEAKTIGVADLTDPPVKLLQADKMYQPVKGTSPSSIYYVVALKDGLKIALRWKGHSISIRAEGVDIAKYSTQLEQGGLEVNLAGHYSAHLHITDPVLGRKTVGAVLAGMGIVFDTPFPNIENLKEKGA